MATEKKTTLDKQPISLPNKTIMVKVVRDAKANLEAKDKKYGDEAIMMSGTFIVRSLPSSEYEYGRGIDIFAKYYATPGNKEGDYEQGEELRKYLESRMGIKSGGLSVNDVFRDVVDFNTDEAESYFWRKKESRIFLNKTGSSLDTATITLRLNIPSDFLKYLVLLQDPKCASSLNAVGKEHLIYLHDPDSYRDEQKSVSDKTFAVMERLSQMKRDGMRLELFVVYRLLFRKNSSYRPTIKIDPIKYTVDDIVSELLTSTRNLSCLNTLNSILEELDPTTLGNMTILQKGIESGLIVLKGTSYFTRENLSLGNSVEVAAANLSKPEYNELVLIINKAYESKNK